MTVILQHNNSEKEVLDKDIETFSTLQCTLKERTDTHDPVLLISGNIGEIAASVNYFTIPEFGRSYFAGSPVSVAANLYELPGTCDVLTSFRDSIRAQRAIIRRQARRWNLDLNDGTLKTYQDPHIVTTLFPNDPFNRTNDSWVLVVAGP